MEVEDWLSPQCASASALLHCCSIGSGQTTRRRLRYPRWYTLFGKGGNMRNVGTSARLPLSGNAALAAGALVQMALGIEFALAGLGKLLDAEFAIQFQQFVAASPAARGGVLAPLLQGLVLPHASIVAQLATSAELGAGLVLVVSSIEVARRRLPGSIGSQHAYETAVALLSACAALLVAGLSGSIYLLEGGGLPRISSASAFGSPIAIELLLVPLALGMAWLEFGRFVALRATRRR